MVGKEPAVILGAVSEVIRAVIPTLIIFKIIQWTPEQVAQFVLFVGVVVGAINTALTRSVANSAVKPIKRRQPNEQTRTD